MILSLSYFKLLNPLSLEIPSKLKWLIFFCAIWKFYFKMEYMQVRIILNNIFSQSCVLVYWPLSIVIHFLIIYVLILSF